MRALALFIVLACAQWALRPDGPEPHGDRINERFSGAVHTAFLGGFRPILVQYLWYEVDRANRDGREIDVLSSLALLQRIDPANAKASLYMAPFLAHTIGSRERTTAGRLRRIGEAIDLLKRAERRIPDDFRLPYLRGLLISGDWVSTDARLYTAWSRQRGKTPSAEAVEAAERARTLAPERPDIARTLAEKLRIRSLELMLADGDPAGAHRLLRRAVAADIEAGNPPTVGVLLTAAWERVMGGLAEEDPARTAVGLRALEQVLRVLEMPSPDIGAVEDQFASAILSHAMDLGSAAVSTASPGDVLSLVVALHNIQAVLEGRLAALGGSGQDPEFLKDLRALTARLLARAPDLKSRVPRSLQ